MPLGSARFHPYLAVKRLPAGHGAGLSQRPHSESDTITTFQLPPSVTESSSSGSLDALSTSHYEPTARTPLHNENIPLSPSGAIEHPPSLSHTINRAEGFCSYN